MWIGANCVLLDGAVIGSDSIIGAASLLRGALPAGAKVGVARGGNPAHNNYRRRFLPDTDLARIMATPGIVFVDRMWTPAGRQSA